ncbi:MAG: TldD/PmbA family protein [Candidatus Zophobacter franzmannii]|nr:TldD/PmbA family protein [Candidatus Zophobacter franzmannii]
MDIKKIAKYSLDKLIAAGGEKVSVIASDRIKTEIQLEHGEINLYRTIPSSALTLSVLLDQRNAHFTLNDLSETEIDKAVLQVIEMAKNSTQDPAFDIAPKHEPKSYKKGELKPDTDQMYDRLAEFKKDYQENYPSILADAYVVHNYSHTYRTNSNGIAFDSEQGYYEFSTMFSAKDKASVSSMNGDGAVLKDLNSPLIECGLIKTYFDQIVGQMTTEQLEGKFQGDLVLLPQNVEFLIGTLLQSNLTVMPLMNKTSLLDGKVGEKIVSDKLTVTSTPDNDEFALGSISIHEGLSPEITTILDKGVLNTYLLGIYGANKTGYDVAKTDGSFLVVEPGNTPYDEMIKDVKEGLLLVRFSGGSPNAFGDISGVAKNSYYIKDGKIQYPVSEVMISGNILDMLNNVKHVSKETKNTGASITPWITIGDVTISGK